MTKLQKFVVFAVACAGVKIAHGATYQGMAVVGGWPVSGINAGADWSSDLGLDYGFGIENYYGWIRGVGQGTLQTSRLIAPNDGGFSLSFQSTSPNDSARGDTYSSGNMTIPGPYTIDEKISPIFKFTIKHKLGENGFGYGISTNASMRHYLNIAGDYIGQPIYYAVFWNMRSTVNGLVSDNAGIQTPDGWHPFHSGPLSSGFVGGNFDSYTSYYPYGTNSIFPAFEITSELGDAAGYPGSGEVEINVWITISTSQWRYVPSTSQMFVTDGSQLKKLNFYDYDMRSTETLDNVPAGSNVIATGDFDKNGTYDVIVRGDADGSGPQPVKTYLWLYLGTSRIKVLRLQNPLLDFTEPLGSHDFDHDGNPEFALFNPTTNRAKLFELSAGDIATGSGTLAYTEKISLPYNSTFTKIIGIADFDYDGLDDLLLRNPVTGAIKYRYMNGLATKYYSTNRKVPLTTQFIGLSHFFTDIDGYVTESQDGVAPRTFWLMGGGGGTTKIAEYDYKGDEAYRSWKVVGFDR